MPNPDVQKSLSLGLSEEELSRMDEEVYQKDGRCIDVVPEYARETVTRLAEKNYEHFCEGFPIFGDFLNVMARNWLERKATFTKIMEAEGFHNEQSNMFSGHQANKMPCLVGLTKACSFVLYQMDPSDSEWGKLTYVQIPNRTGEAKFWESGTKEQVNEPGKFNTPSNIAVGQRADISWKTEQGESAKSICTTRLIDLFSQRNESLPCHDISEIHQVVEEAFVEVDHRTIVPERKTPKNSEPEFPLEGIINRVRRRLAEMIAPG